MAFNILACATEIETLAATAILADILGLKPCEGVINDIVQALICAGVDCGPTALAALFSATVQWNSKPPTTLENGQRFIVQWQINGGQTIISTNVHFGTNPDPKTVFQYVGQSQPAGAGAPGVFVATVSLPPASFPPGTTFYFVVEAVVDGVAHYSNTVTSTISGTTSGSTAAAVQVSFEPVQVPPIASANCNNEYDFTVVLKESNGVGATVTGIDVDQFSGLNPSQLGLPGYVAPFGQSRGYVTYCRAAGTSNWTIHGKDDKGNIGTWTGQLSLLGSTTASGPTIISFTPTSGPVGAPVTITGTGFSATPAGNTVKFNGISAPVSSSTAISIVTAVPVGATTGPITVTTANGTAISSASFQVTTTTATAGQAYVNNFGSNSVSVIDTSSDAVVGTIQVGAGPGPIRLTPGGVKAYVGNFNANSISVIATATNTVVGTTQVGSGPCNIAMAPNGAKAYVTNLKSASVSVINTATDTVSSTIQVGSQPCALAISPDGAKLYVANRTDGSLSAIDTATDTVRITIPVGSSPFPIAFTPNGAKAYVVNGQSNSVSVIDVATDTETKRIAVGSVPADIGILPDGSKAYVANSAFTFTLGSVSVIDIASDSVTKTVAIGGFNPSVIGIAPNGAKTYVAHTGSPYALGDISVIESSGDTVTKSFGVGNRPVFIAFTPDGVKAYVGNTDSGTVSVIDTATDTVLNQPIRVGTQPVNIAIRPTAPPPPPLPAVHK